jgi:hypothetical protein
MPCGQEREWKAEKNPNLSLASDRALSEEPAGIPDYYVIVSVRP